MHRPDVVHLQRVPAKIKALFEEPEHGGSAEPTPS